MCLLLSPTREPNLQSTHNNKKDDWPGGMRGFRSGIRIRIGSVNSFVNATRQQFSISLSHSLRRFSAPLPVYGSGLFSYFAIVREGIREIFVICRELCLAWHSSLTLGFSISTLSLVISLVFGPISNRLPAQSKQVITEIYMARFERAVIPMQISHNNNNNNNSSNNCK